MRITRLVLRKPMIAALLVLAAGGVASAQNRPEPPVWISFFTSGGALSGSGAMVNYIGDDVTFRVYKGLGLGVGGEAGREFGADGGFVLFSGNVSYHFKRLERWNPFITGGYSTIFRQGTREGGGNFGAGVKYWFNNHVGLHLEFRNHIFTGAARSFSEFRIGFGLR